MAIYNFTIPNFHITQIRSAHKDTLYASAGLRVMNANGGLHSDLTPQGASLGDHGAGEEVGLNLSFKNVDVPDPTPDNPDGGAIYWTFLLVNQGHADITASGFVAVINKAADAFAGALADKVGEGAAVTVGSLYGLAAILGIQELVNLITADCDGTVAVGDIELTAANLAGLVPITGQAWTQNQNNPGTDSPAGCGRNSDYVVTYQIQNLTPGIWHTDDITASTSAPAAAGDPSGYMFDAQGSQHVVYRSQDGHIHELWWQNGAWNTDDITASTSAPAAAGDPSGYMFDAQGSQHVVYRSQDGHIHELWWG
jgi:hypothetical protein